MIIPDSEVKSPVKAPHADEQMPLPDQSPPPYSPSPQDSSVNPTQPSRLPPDLSPTNYLHIKEKNGSVKQKVLLDLNVPRPPASALPAGIRDSEIPNLNLDSHNGSVSGEVWVLRAAKSQDPPAQRDNHTSERAHMHFGSHNGAVKALVHLHPEMAEPRPFLSIDVKSLNGAIMITIPRSFRGQLTLHTDNGSVHLSSTLAPRAATLSNLDGTRTFFVGERPSGGRWHTGASKDGEEVDEVVGWAKNGSVKVSYDDEDQFLAIAYV
ncbi:hypothetical protein BJV78DRAFT_639611 [Lactifluus subvellereus]|nr:hypothetical protein BJV78DRAFT_639611 [Lactifluus subvellereus]